MKFKNSTNMNQKKYSKNETSKNIVKILVKIPPILTQFFTINQKNAQIQFQLITLQLYIKKREANYGSIGISACNWSNYWINGDCKLHVHAISN